MVNPNKVNAATLGLSGTQYPVGYTPSQGLGSAFPGNYIDFTNSSGVGAGGTPTPIEYVIPAMGEVVNAFSQKDWFTYMQGTAAGISSGAYGLIIATSIQNTNGAVIILGASVLTS